MTLLFDSCILIDILRGYAPAIDYMEREKRVKSLSAVTIGELYAGLRKPKEESALLALLKEFSCHALDEQTAKLGGSFRQKFGPSHHTDFNDALIAATAHTHGLTLITRNAKHFPMLGDGVESPY